MAFSLTVFAKKVSEVLILNNSCDNSFESFKFEMIQASDFIHPDWEKPPKNKLIPLGLQ